MKVIEIFNLACIFSFSVASTILFAISLMSKGYKEEEKYIKKDAIILNKVLFMAGGVCSVITFITVVIYIGVFVVK